MNLMRMPLAGILLALGLAAPATGFSGGGLAGALQPRAGTVASARTEATHTCQAGRNHEKTKLNVAGDARKPAVVACEQPPKSELTAPSLKQTAATGEAALG